MGNSDYGRLRYGLSLFGIASGEKAKLLADKMSSAWINFAKTGEPGWENYTRENGATMIFDDISEVVYKHDDELMKLLQPDYEF